MPDFDLRRLRTQTQTVNVYNIGLRYANEMRDSIIPRACSRPSRRAESRFVQSQQEKLASTTAYAAALSGSTLDQHPETQLYDLR
jgi:hypothetical protein